MIDVPSLEQGDTIRIYGPAVIEFLDLSGKRAVVSIHAGEAIQVKVLSDAPDIHTPR
jgi:hypothetical protein